MEVDQESAVGLQAQAGLNTRLTGQTHQPFTASPNLRRIPAGLPLGSTPHTLHRPNEPHPPRSSGRPHTHHKRRAQGGAEGAGTQQSPWTGRHTCRSLAMARRAQPSSSPKGPLLNQPLLAATIPDDWHKAIPDDWHKAIVVEGYRPISLLSTSYKLFAKLLHSRLQAALDDRRREIQYGFRATRSTSQPIHIIRRLIERAEATGQSLYTILLDWEKAFDKIHPEALLTALTRYGVPPHFTGLIKNIYTSPQFTVAAAGKQSSTAEASAGIRQGCPLSPYLFLIVHGMVMHDVDQELTANGQSVQPKPVLLRPSVRRRHSTPWNARCLISG